MRQALYIQSYHIIIRPAVIFQLYDGGEIGMKVEVS